MQALYLDFVQAIMKMGRKRTVIHTVHYVFGLRSYEDSCGHNIKQDQVNILKYLGLHIKLKCGSQIPRQRLYFFRVSIQCPSNF